MAVKTDCRDYLVYGSVEDYRSRIGNCGVEEGEWTPMRHGELRDAIGRVPAPMIIRYLIRFGC